MSDMARASFKSRIEREKRIAAGEEEPAAKSSGGGGDAAMTMIPIIEICRYSPGTVTAMGVSMRLTSAALMSKGKIAQKERCGPDRLTLDPVGACAITAPGSRPHAFGPLLPTAPRAGGDDKVGNV